jgi:TusA-related sulfurtransferase
MTNSPRSSSPPISSSPGDAPTAATERSSDLRDLAPPGSSDPRDLAPPGSSDPRDPAPEGVNHREPGHGAQDTPRSIDLCGELCPFTFVRTKLALEQLPIGAALRVIVDHEPATRNIPRSATEWGQEVMAVTALSARTWAIDLRKRVR